MEASPFATSTLAVMMTLAKGIWRYCGLPSCTMDSKAVKPLPGTWHSLVLPLISLAFSRQATSISLSVGRGILASSKTMRRFSATSKATSRHSLPIAKTSRCGSWLVVSMVSLGFAWRKLSPVH